MKTPQVLHQNPIKIVDNRGFNFSGDDTEFFSCLQKEEEHFSNWLFEASNSKHTQKAYSRWIRHILSHTRLLFRDWTKEHVLEFLNQPDKNYSQNTKQTVAGIVKSLFLYLEDVNYIQKSPFRRLRFKVQKNLVNRVLTVEEINRLIKAAKPGRDEVLIKFLYVTALRVSEAASLRFSDFKVDKEKVWFNVKGKGGDTESVFINDEVLKWVFSLKEDSEPLESFVFKSTKESAPRVSINDPLPGLSAKAMWDIVKRTSKKAGVQLSIGAGGKVTSKASPHFFRHSNATHSLSAGKSLTDIMRMLRHKSPQTSMVYAKIAEEITTCDVVLKKLRY